MADDSPAFPSLFVPRQFQLEAILATLNGRDSIITAGTGCGKTLCLIIPNLLRPDTIISPLKRLQITQVRFKLMLTHIMCENELVAGERMHEIWYIYNIN